MVYILLGPGFEEAEVVVPADLLRRGGVEVALVGLTGPEVTGSHNITLKADMTLDQVSPDHTQALMFPGGMGGVAAISDSPEALELIRRIYEDGRAYLAAICAAPSVVLGPMGILQGRRAVCYPGMEGGMTGAIPCMDVPVSVDGKVVTGKGPGAAFDFGLKLVELLAGSETACQVRDGAHYHG